MRCIVYNTPLPPPYLTPPLCATAKAKAARGQEGKKVSVLCKPLFSWKKRGFGLYIILARAVAGASAYFTRWPSVASMACACCIACIASGIKCMVNSFIIIVFVFMIQIWGLYGAAV